MEFRWKQGTGQPPIGAIIVSDNNIIIWQVLQYAFDYAGAEIVWVDVKVVSCPDD